MAPVTDLERLGSFHLGRMLRAGGSVGPEPLLYDAEDPTTHAVCVGMTGSERADPEALQERIASAVSGILVLLGIEADPLQSREHILLANVLEKCAAREHGDVERAREEHTAAEAELRELDAAFRADAAALRDARAESEPAELRLRARKSDLAVERVALVWRPYWVDAEGRAQPAFATPA